ncbi:hypothetical protein CFC21_029843 [Triticum aestivum]|uniref:Uncharacterized protein n=2 Tax=Triticum aestivum TaxID=4565 RepID=A0A9R1EU25_WHEAT|nr:hypothetical protein CFC21_029843 [Triticum aestivum]
MAAAAAKVVVLLLLVIHVLGVVVGAARPLEGDHGWTGNGIEMVTQMLSAAKSRSSTRTHCC